MRARTRSCARLVRPVQGLEAVNRLIQGMVAEALLVVGIAVAIASATLLVTLVTGL